MGNNNAILEMLALGAGAIGGSYLGAKIGKVAGELVGAIGGAFAGLALTAYLISKWKEKKSATEMGYVEVFTG